MLLFCIHFPAFNTEYHNPPFNFLLLASKINFQTGYQVAQSTRIALKWREGVEATSFETLAKKDNLDSVHTELLRLEDSVHNIHLELQNIRRKEEQMRDVNGKRRNEHFVF